MSSDIYPAQEVLKRKKKKKEEMKFKGLLYNQSTQQSYPTTLQKQNVFMKHKCSQ